MLLRETDVEWQESARDYAERSRILYERGEYAKAEAFRRVISCSTRARCA